MEMYQISLRGCFETQDPEQLLTKINEALKETKSSVIGQFSVVMLPPYIDYQTVE